MYGYVQINIYSSSEFASCSSRVPRPFPWGSFHAVLLPMCLRGAASVAVDSAQQLGACRLFSATAVGSESSPGKVLSPPAF